MQNLEQIRAAAALDFYAQRVRNRRNRQTRGREDGDVVRGLPSLVLNNGLLATMAYAQERQGDYAEFMNEIGRFLVQRGLIQGDDYIRVLSNVDSITLRRATQEALAYLAFLKRFRPVG